MLEYWNRRYLPSASEPRKVRPRCDVCGLDATHRLVPARRKIRFVCPEHAALTKGDGTVAEAMPG